MTMGMSMRCSKSRDHKCSIFKHLFFEGLKLYIWDIFMFTKCYLDNLTLKQRATFSGVSYGSRAVDWVEFIRELMKEFYKVHFKNMTISGTIEPDESIFGRRVKYHWGNLA